MYVQTLLTMTSAGYAMLSAQSMQLYLYYEIIFSVLVSSILQIYSRKEPEQAFSATSQPHALNQLEGLLYPCSWLDMLLA